MPTATLLRTRADIAWLKQTHLKSTALPEPYDTFRLAVLYGNEDAPTRVTLHHRDSIYAPYLEVNLEATPPICVEHAATAHNPHQLQANPI